MKVMPGVTVEDMGHKMGLNGVDNAKLSFDQVNLCIAGYLSIFPPDAENNNKLYIK